MTKGRNAGKAEIAGRARRFGKAGKAPGERSCENQGIVQTILQDLRDYLLVKFQWQDVSKQLPVNGETPQAYGIGYVGDV